MILKKKINRLQKKQKKNMNIYPVGKGLNMFFFSISDEPSLDSITLSWKEYESPIEPRPCFMHLSPVVSLQPVSVVRLQLPTLELSQSPTFQVPKFTLSEEESTKAFYSYIQNRLANDNTTSRSILHVDSVQIFTYTFICVLSFALFLDVYPTTLFE